MKFSGLISEVIKIRNGNFIFLREVSCEERVALNLSTIEYFVE